MANVQGFVRQESRRILVVRTDAGELLTALAEYEPPVSALQRARERHAQNGTGGQEEAGR